MRWRVYCSFQSSCKAETWMSCIWKEKRFFRSMRSCKTSFCDKRVFYEKMWYTLADWTLGCCKFLIFLTIWTHIKVPYTELVIKTQSPFERHCALDVKVMILKTVIFVFNLLSFSNLLGFDRSFFPYDMRGSLQRSPFKNMPYQMMQRAKFPRLSVLTMLTVKFIHTISLLSPWISFSYFPKG